MSALEFDLTIPNYRCFSTEGPVHFGMRKGITSLVGPNNSGKSSLLRLFYELKPVFTHLRQAGVQSGFARGTSVTGHPKGVGDPIEVCHNRNDHDAMVEVRFSATAENQVSGLDLKMSRKTPALWSIDFRIGQRHQIVQQAHPQLRIQTGQPQDSHDLSLLDRFLGDMQKALYLPATRVAVGESQADVYDLRIGRAFIALWDQWKTGPARDQNAAIQRVTDDIATLFGFRHLEISATPDKQDLHVAIDRRPYKLRELGAGLAQFIIVLANTAVHQPVWLLIDEPEISLHPSLQLDFLTTLASYASGGVLFATHSVGLARSADRIFSLKRDGGRSLLSPFEAGGSLPEFLGEMGFAAYREMGFDTVLLVEGVNDIKTAQQFLRLLRKDHRVVVLQLGGSQMIRKERMQELSEVLRITQSVHVLIDSEKASQDQPLAKNRAEFLEGCASLRIHAAATERRAMEHYLSDRAVKRTFGETSRSLGFFEDRASGNPWPKSESWKAAREMTPDELLATDVGSFLERL